MCGRGSTGGPAKLYLFIPQMGAVFSFQLFGVLLGCLGALCLGKGSDLQTDPAAAVQSLSPASLLPSGCFSHASTFFLILIFTGKLLPVPCTRMCTCIDTGGSAE